MKKLLVIVTCIIIAAFAIAGAAYGVHKYNSRGTTAAEKAESVEDIPADEVNTVTPDDNTTEYGISDSDPLKDLKLSLIVNLSQEDLDRIYAEYSKEFLDSSMPSRNDERCSAAAKVGWGKPNYKLYDAVSFPFSTVEKDKKKYTDEDVEKMVEELREEIMRNPVVLDMLLQAMKEMKLTDDTTVSSLNADWVDSYLGLYDEYGCGAFVTYHTRYWEKYGFELPHDNEDVDAWRMAHPNAPEPETSDLELIPLNDDESTPVPTAGAYGRNGKVEKPTNQYKLFVTDYHVDTAKRALSWLDRCTVLGVETYSTTKHWPLNSTQNANEVRTYMNTDKEYVDAQPALMFSVMTKDAKKQILFGFNIYDMRIELFERTATPVKAVTPKPQPTPTPTPTPVPQPTPTPVPVPTPTPTPTPEPTPTPNPTPEPTPEKDPYDDPVHNGNADKGGGEGQGETPKNPTPDPSKEDMQDAHGGQDQNQGHSDPGTVTPVTPDPGPGHSDNEGKQDDNNPSTIEHTDEVKDDYGQEDNSQQDSVTDDNSGKTSNPDDESSGGEFSEPGI